MIINIMLCPSWDSIRQAEAMSEFGLSETLRATIVQEQEHEIDLSAALGIALPLPKKESDSKAKQGVLIPKSSAAGTRCSGFWCTPRPNGNSPQFRRALDASHSLRLWITSVI